MWTLLSEQKLQRNLVLENNLFKSKGSVANCGYVHTVLDRFLLRFKGCSGTVWTGINILLRCRNCSEAFPVWTEALSVMQFATLSFDLKRSFTKTRFRCNFCAIKVFRLDSNRFKNLSDTERSTFNSGAEQYCSGTETASKAAFLVWTETLSGTLSATLRFTIRYSVNIACVTDRASVHAGNASEQFLHRNRTLILVHTVPEQLLQWSKNLSGTVWT